MGLTGTDVALPPFGSCRFPAIRGGAWRSDAAAAAAVAAIEHWREEARTWLSFRDLPPVSPASALAVRALLLRILADDADGPLVLHGLGAFPNLARRSPAEALRAALVWRAKIVNYLDGGYAYDNDVPLGDADRGALLAALSPAVAVGCRFCLANAGGAQGRRRVAPGPSYDWHPDCAVVTEWAAQNPPPSFPDVPPDAFAIDDPARSTPIVHAILAWRQSWGRWLERAPPFSVRLAAILYAAGATRGRTSHGLSLFPDIVSAPSLGPEELRAVLRWRAKIVDFLSDVWDVAGTPEFDVIECGRAEEAFTPEGFSHERRCCYCFDALPPTQTPETSHVQRCPANPWVPRCPLG